MRRPESRIQVGLLTAATLVVLTVLRTVAAAPLPTSPTGADAAADVIVGTLELPGGHVAEFQVRDGSMLFAQRDDATSAVAFAPRARAQGVAWLSLLVDEFAIRQPDSTRPVVEAVGTMHAVTIDDGDFALLTTRVGAAQQPIAQPRYTSLRPQQLLEVHGRSGDGTCCVTANGWTVCSAVVELGQMSCRATPIVIGGPLEL